MSSSQTGDALPKLSRSFWSLPVPPACPAVRSEVARRLAGRFGSPAAIGGRPRKHAYGAALAALDSDSDDEQNASDSDESLTAMRPRVKRRAQAVLDRRSNLWQIVPLLLDLPPELKAMVVRACVPNMALLAELVSGGAASLAGVDQRTLARVARDVLPQLYIDAGIVQQATPHHLIWIVNPLLREQMSALADRAHTFEWERPLGMQPNGLFRGRQLSEHVALLFYHPDALAEVAGWPIAALPWRAAGLEEPAAAYMGTLAPLPDPHTLAAGMVYARS